MNKTNLRFIAKKLINYQNLFTYETKKSSSLNGICFFPDLFFRKNMYFYIIKSRTQMDITFR